jgi:hypothetical protein
MPFMRTLLAGLTGVCLLVMPVGLSAWGMEVHRFVTTRAIDGLPPELKPFYTARRAFISEHAVDPDLWRIVGLKNDKGEEDPNHFLDMDGLDEPRPFTNVPRDWDAYVKRYGPERANRNGRLPWRTEEVYKLLVARFQDIAKGQPYAADNAAYLSAALMHYVQDAHVPFHAVTAYDGQATNQRGIHARFETDLVLRVRDTLTFAPVTIRPVSEIKAFIFDRLAESEALVDSILAADRAATAGREFYDDGYFEVFAKGARPIVERRLSDAASSAASVIVAAWTEAGRPALPVGSSSTPARIRR